MNNSGGDGGGFSSAMGSALVLALALGILFGPIIIYLAWRQAKYEIGQEEEGA